MAITVTCPSCSTAFPVDPAKIPEGGVNARCSSCGDVFRVEKPVEPDPLPTLEDFAPDEPASPPRTPPTQPATPQSPQAAPQPPTPVPEPPAPPAEPTASPSEPEQPAAGQSAADPFAQPAPFEQAAPDTDAQLPAETAEPLPAPEPEEPLPPAETTEPPPETTEPPPAPQTEDGAPAPSPQPPEPGEPQPGEAVAETSAPAVQGFTFGKRDPKDKAKRLARVLVSDMIMYNAERHQSALAQGTLQQDFEEEIEKSWKEFVDQVGEELADAEGRQYWRDALNDILAKGDEVF